jgi:purine-binding chemotaxis protein CheW
MDLAEIRKKAKSEKETPKGPATAGRMPSPAKGMASIQGAPVEEKTAPSEAIAPLGPEPAYPGAGASPAAPEGFDPLEALFSSRPEMHLATEESYLQGLLGVEQRDEGLIRQWLTFTLGDEEYAVDIEDVLEIIKPREITDIPRVPDFVLGIISLRGIIIPVYDLKSRLKLGSIDVSLASRIIVCQSGERTAGLLVDGITQVIRVPEKQIEPPPAVLSGLDRDLVDVVGRHQGRMMILLHLPSVLDAELT